MTHSRHGLDAQQGEAETAKYADSINVAIYCN